MARKRPPGKFKETRHETFWGKCPHAANLAALGCFVPGNRAGQPWEAGMDVLLGQMTFNSINSSLFNQ